MFANKKRLLVIIAIGVVLAGIGEFAFNGSPEPAPTHMHLMKPVKGGAKAEQLVASNSQQNGAAPSTTVIDPNAAAAQPAPQVQGRDPFNGSMYETPAPDRNQKPPVLPPHNPPGTGDLNSKLGPLVVTKEQLPNPELKGGIGPDGKKSDFQLIGVITGIRPAVVFQTPDGHQQLVQLGNSLAPGTQVVGVSRAKATVINNGQELKMTVGADNPTEKR